MKKFILSILLLFVVCNGCYAKAKINIAERINLSDRQQLRKGTLYSIIKDNKTGCEYLLVESDSKIGGYAITPLIKPAVYTHKK